MKSKATTVDEYLAQAPEKQRPALETLRVLCLDELAGYEEGMRHGMPSYSRDGNAVEVAFAGQKNYISLYVLRHRVVEANRHLLRWPLGGPELYPLQAIGANRSRDHSPLAVRHCRRHRSDLLA